MRLPFSGSYPLTQGFGGGDYSQFGLKGHDGLDYGLPTGTQVLAPHDGTVYSSYDAGGYGNFIFITGSQYQSVVAHLQKFVVASGTVKEGQLIAYSDNTGNSTAPHLHWGVRPIPYNSANGYAGYIDQRPLLTGGSNMPTEDEVKYVYSVAEGNAPTAADLQYYMTHPWKKLSDRGLLKQGDRYKAQIAKLQAQIDAGATVLNPGIYKVK